MSSNLLLDVHCVYWYYVCLNGNPPGFIIILTFEYTLWLNWLKSRPIWSEWMYCLHFHSNTVGPYGTRPTAE